MEALVAVGAVVVLQRCVNGGADGQADEQVGDGDEGGDWRGEVSKKI